MPRMLPPGRWALTPPFHPYLACARRYIFCDTFRQPRLASKLPPAFPGRIALWCPDFPPPNLRRDVAATALVPFKSIKLKSQLTIPRLEYQNQAKKNLDYITTPRTQTNLTPSRSMDSKCTEQSTPKQRQSEMSEPEWLNRYLWRWESGGYHYGVSPTEPQPPKPPPHLKSSK